MKGQILRIARMFQKIYGLRNSKVPGLSKFELYRLRNYKKFKPGTAVFFGFKFHFSDVNGFLHSVEEIFKEEVYRFHSESLSPLIIDCGSNIGLSLFYFKKLFPNARILAFEPDIEIFRILENNVNLLSISDKVELRREAVWTRDEEISFYSEGSLAGSAIVDFLSTNKQQKVKAVDLNKYLNQEIDFLKIDIEGAENDVIFHVSENLRNVKNLFLEYHGIINQRQNLGDILNLITDAGFEYYIRVAGETIQFPFCNEKPVVFNQQLNIICYRKNH